MPDRQASNSQKSNPPAIAEETILEEIRKAIYSVRYGTVQIIVQDGRVVQIDKTEKIRLT